ncbi:hypothetical protein AOLI_G00124390 [Acnodon oligacanthus]
MLLAEENPFESFPRLRGGDSDGSFHGHEGDHALRRIRLDGDQLPRALIGQRFSIESPPPLLCQIRCAFIESAAGRRALLRRSPLRCCTRHREHNFGHAREDNGAGWDQWRTV